MNERSSVSVEVSSWHGHIKEKDKAVWNTSDWVLPPQLHELMSGNGGTEDWNGSLADFVVLAPQHRFPLHQVKRPDLTLGWRKRCWSWEVKRVSGRGRRPWWRQEDRKRNKEGIEKRLKMVKKLLINHIRPTKILGFCYLKSGRCNEKNI